MYNFPQLNILTDVTISITLLALGGILLSHTLQFYQPQNGRYIYITAWCLLLSISWIYLSRFLYSSILDADLLYYKTILQTTPIRIGFAFLLFGLIAIISLLWYTLQDQHENEKRKRDAENLAKSAELQTLRQQLQPHFLFNSLNSISALVGSNPVLARQMIHQLSDFLRGTLRKEENEWISFTEEVNHLNLYLAIEKVRFGHRLNTVLNLSETTNNASLPAMLLQPLVENAIKFSLYDTIGDVTILINASLSNNHLQITIENPFDAETAAAKKGTGFGLNGLNRRLFLLFGRTDLLKTTHKNNIFEAALNIPQI